MGGRGLEDAEPSHTRAWCLEKDPSRSALSLWICILLPTVRSRGAVGCLPHLVDHVSYCLFVDMINKQDCKYGDNCTFAYHQEEIDVWTEERKGTLNRDLLFDPLGGVKRGSLTIAKLLKEHQGIFTFLCEVPACPASSPVAHGPRHNQGWLPLHWLSALKPVGMVRPRLENHQRLL